MRLHAVRLRERLIGAGCVNHTVNLGPHGARGASRSVALPDAFRVQPLIFTVQSDLVVWHSLVVVAALCVTMRLARECMQCAAAQQQHPATPPHVSSTNHGMCFSSTPCSLSKIGANVKPKADLSHARKLALAGIVA